MNVIKVKCVAYYRTASPSGEGYIFYIPGDVYEMTQREYERLLASVGTNTEGNVVEPSGRFEVV